MTTDTFIEQLEQERLEAQFELMNWRLTGAELEQQQKKIMGLLHDYSKELLHNINIMEQKIYIENDKQRAEGIPFLERNKLFPHRRLELIKKYRSFLANPTFRDINEWWNVDFEEQDEWRLKFWVRTYFYYLIKGGYFFEKNTTTVIE